MAEAITLNRFRRKLAAALAGGPAVPRIAFMAFGDGGHDPNTLQAIAPNPDQAALVHELLRKPLATVTQEDLYSVTGLCVLEDGELVGYTISEVALIDDAGDLTGVKNFAPKVKEADERYETSIKLRF